MDLIRPPYCPLLLVLVCRIDLDTRKAESWDLGGAVRDMWRLSPSHSIASLRDPPEIWLQSPETKFENGASPGRAFDVARRPRRQTWLLRLCDPSMDLKMGWKSIQNSQHPLIDSGQTVPLLLVRVYRLKTLKLKRLLTPVSLSRNGFPELRLTIGNTDIILDSFKYVIDSLLDTGFLN